MLSTSPIWCLPLQHSSPCSSISERRLQSHQTARLKNWLTDSVTGLLLTVYDCLWNNARGRNKDTIPFVPHHWLLPASPAFSKPLDSSWQGTVLDVRACWVPLLVCWELKPPFYFLQTRSPYFSFSFSGQRRPTLATDRPWSQIPMVGAYSWGFSGHGTEAQIIADGSG